MGVNSVSGVARSMVTQLGKMMASSFVGGTVGSYVEDAVTERAGENWGRAAGLAARFGSGIATYGVLDIVDQSFNIGGLYKADAAIVPAEEGACFIAGTAVALKDGEKSIEEVAVGDEVLCADPETGEYAYRTVTKTFVNQTEDLTTVTVNGEQIVSTPNHPYYVEGKGWVEASALHEGQTVWLANGTKITVEAVSNQTLQKPILVYNFEVEDFHTYFVGECGVLVHNCNQSSQTPITNPNGQQIYQTANDQWKDASNNRYAVGPDGPVVHPSNTGTGTPSVGPPEDLIRGQYTESRVLSLLHLPKNVQLWINGHIPDAVWPNGRPVEIKDCQYLYASTQLKAFGANNPFDLIVTPDTVIAKPLFQLMQKCGGDIYVIDPESGFITNINP